MGKEVNWAKVTFLSALSALSVVKNLRKMVDSDRVHCKERKKEDGNLCVSLRSLWPNPEQARPQRTPRGKAATELKSLNGSEKRRTKTNRGLRAIWTIAVAGAWIGIRNSGGRAANSSNDSWSP